MAKIDRESSYQKLDMTTLLMGSVDAILTNHPSAVMPPDGVDQLLKMEMESDMAQMKSDVDDIQEDLRQIKARLGVRP